MDIIESLHQVKDEDVPRMLFLSVDPTRVNEDDLKVDFIPTSKDGDSGGFVTTKEIVKGDESDAAGKLLNKFKMALQEKSISPLRHELQVRLLSLSSLQQPISCENFSTLERKELNPDEEDVLKFTEILERFNCPVPGKMKESFDAIVGNKSNSLRESKGSKKETFFVCPENKVLMEMCSCLSAFEVCAMYVIIREDEKNDAKKLSVLPHVPLEVLQEVAGLKDVAFFCLVLTLMRNNMMNCLYTHNLNFLLEELKQIHMKNKQDHSHIDRALASLCRYPVASHPPGLCLIFTMMEGRPGAEEDLKSVKNLFENVFMYDVIVKKDPTADEINSVISDLEAVRNKFYDSLVVWFMSHGSESRFTVKDGKIHRREELIQPVANIKWFNKKPKLFFIQACAVKEKRQVDSKESSVAVEIDNEKIPAGDLWKETYAHAIDMTNVNNLADTLVSCATMWYEPAGRNEKGSLYVDTLVDQLQQHGSKESIESVLLRVNYNVNTVRLRRKEVVWKQAPYFECSLQKKFFFPKTSDQ